MKRPYILFASLMISTSLLAGCGNQQVDDGKIRISVCDKVTGKQGIDAWTRKRQEAFAKEYPNIIVDYKSNPTTDTSKNVQAVINNLSSPATAQTLLITNNNTYARTVYQTGLTEDWSKYMTEEELNEYDPKIIQYFKSGDALTGLPKTQEFPLLGFNKKILRSQQVKINLGIDPNAEDANAQVEAMVDAIKTWDDFYNFAKCLSGTYKVLGEMTDVSGYGGYLTDYYIGLGVWNVANNYKAAIQNPNGTIDFDLTNPETVETIEFLQKLVKDGVLTHDVNLGYQDFFDRIFANRIASFIYYPSWSATWFEPKGIYASDIKVINVPYGPSITALKEQAKTDDSVVVPSTNVNFSINYVMNKAATDEQKRAAVTYVKYMYGKEAFEDQCQFAKEEVIPLVYVPPYKFDDSYMDQNIFANIPNDYKSALRNSTKDYYAFDIDADSFTTYIKTSIPGVVKGEDSLGKYDTREKTIARLQQLNNIVYNEWLNAYNEKKLNG